MSVPVGQDVTAGPCVRLTVSVGVASLDRIGPELSDLIAAADAALYVAKQAGRNKTQLATGSTPLAQVIPAARPAPSA
jgi:diguanylate cyclase (GGDEF)-like protein